MVGGLLNPDFRAELRENLSPGMYSSIARFGFGFNHPSGLVTYTLDRIQAERERLWNLTNELPVFGTLLLILRALSGGFVLAFRDFPIEFLLLLARFGSRKRAVIARDQPPVGALAQDQNFTGLLAACGKFAVLGVLAEIGALAVGVVLYARVICPIAFDRAANDLQRVLCLQPSPSE